jgi:hypothetical protein
LVTGTTYLTKTMTYDITGQLRSSTDFNSNPAYYCYTDTYVNGTPPGPTNLMPTTITAPISSGSTTRTYYEGTAQLASVTDSNGKKSTFTYADGFNRLTDTSLPNGGWTHAQFDLSTTSPPLQTGTELYTGITSTSPTNCSSCRHDQAIWDGLGRTSTIYLVNDPDGQTQVDTQYDADGRAKTLSNPHRSASAPTDGLETPSYDGMDRVTSVQHADTSLVSTYYGAAITSTLGQTTQQCTPTSTYGIGFPTLVVDEAGNKRETWTDGFGRAIETDEPNPSGSLAVYTCYTYDLNNNLVGTKSSALSPNQTRTYAYDMLSRITSKTQPETGAATVSGVTYFYYTTSGGAFAAATSLPFAARQTLGALRRRIPTTR